MAWSGDPSTTGKEGQLKSGSHLKLENPRPERGCRTPTEALGKARTEPVATPPPRSRSPGLHHTPKQPGPETKRRGGNEDRALPLQGDLGHVSAVSSSAKGGQATMAASSTRAVGGLGTLDPQLRGNSSPSPHADRRRLPRRPVCAHASYLRSGRRTLPPPETCRRRGPPRAPELRGPPRPPARPRGGPSAAKEPSPVPTLGTSRAHLSNGGRARKVTARPSEDFRRR